MFNSVVSATLRILLFRAGPADFPYAPELSRVIIPLALMANFALAATMAAPPALAALTAAVSVFGMALATRSVLRMRQLENRYTQTFQALMTTSSLLILLLTLPMAELMPAIIKVAQNPALLEQDPESLQLPAGPALLVDLLVIWNLAVTTRIYRLAGDMKLLPGVVTTLLILFGLMMFAGFVSSLAAALFGLTPVAAP